MEREYDPASVRVEIKGRDILRDAVAFHEAMHQTELARFNATRRVAFSAVNARAMRAKSKRERKAARRAGA